MFLVFGPIITCSYLIVILVAVAVVFTYDNPSFIYSPVMYCVGFNVIIIINLEYFVKQFIHDYFYCQ